MLHRLLTFLKRRLCLKRQRKPGQPVFFLRIVRKIERWQRTEAGNFPTAEDVLIDLTLRDKETGLSIYKLSDQSEANELASVYSLTLRDNPAHFEYVLFPEAVLSGYSIMQKPEESHPRFLSVRHYEVLAPTQEQLLELARRILHSPDKKEARLMRQEIVDFVIEHELLETEELRGRVGDKWQKLIKRKKSSRQ